LERDVDRAIRLRFTPTRRKNSLLVLGGFTDCDPGGRVLSELLRNFRICIDEKTKKIAPYRHRYPEWWVAFEDRSSWGELDREELDKLRAALGDATGFTRLLLVNPLDPARGLDLLAGYAL
jgi:hypothetical protein